MRGIADQREARVIIPRRVHRRERIRPPPPHQFRCPQVIPQPLAHLAQKPHVIQGRQPLHDLMPVGEHNRREVRVLRGPGHRQLRERPAGQEMLQRHALMRLLMRNGAHHGGLSILQPRHRYPSLPAQLRATAVRRHHQPGGEHLIAHHHAHAIGITRHLRLRRRAQRHPRRIMQPPVNRNAQAPRLDDPAERAIPHRARIKMQPQRRGRAPDLSIRHVDLNNRAGGKRQRLPKPGHIQQPLAPRRNGIGPPIEIRVLHRRQRGPVHQQHALTLRGQGAGQSPADRPGPDDRNVMAECHAANLADSARTAKHPGGFTWRTELPTHCP